MTGYDLLIRLKKTRRTHILTATEQALYHELGSICNEGEWCEIFTCSNEELCRNLNISENTLINSRAAIMEAGLVYYKSGKSKRTLGQYSFQKQLTTSNSEVVEGKKKKSTTSKFATKTAKTTSNSEDYNKTKKQTLPVSNETGAAEKLTTSKFEVVEKVKKEKTEYWQALVDRWFEFYKKQFSINPTFEGTAAKSLKSIIRRLKKISVDAGKGWTESYALRVFNRFLEMAINDSWRKENFMLHILSSHFDAIIKKKEEKQAETNETDQYLQQRKKQEEHTRKIMNR